MPRRADPKPTAQREQARTGRRGRSLLAALCGFVGRLTLLLVILACLPVPLAHLCGYEMYNVVSGSMEPAIPVGSAVYVRSVQPSAIQPGDVIAFTSGSSVITHRVVENDPLESSIVTKGDANAQPDLRPVRYNEVIGRIEHQIPMLGGLLSVYTGGEGRWYLIGLAVAGALLSLLGRGTGQKQPAAGGETAGPDAIVPPPAQTLSSGTADGEAAASAPSGADEPATAFAGVPRGTPAGGLPAGRARGQRLRRRVMAVLAVVFVLSAGAAGYLYWNAAQQRQTYEQAAQQYTIAAARQSEDAPPITVDFDALCARNSDVVGWLYCEGTGINYPIMYGSSNDTYLRRDIDKNYSNAGSIFIEVLNQPDFSDYNTVIYGHNMGDGSMFAPLQQWQQQEFFDQHPVFWLLTPQQNYKVLLFSAYQTSALSGTYTIFTSPGEKLDAYLRTAAQQSLVEAQTTPDGGAHHLLLSTCATAYGDDDGRHVLHGMLQPVGQGG